MEQENYLDVELLRSFNTFILYKIFKTISFISVPAQPNQIFQTILWKKCFKVGSIQYPDIGGICPPNIARHLKISVNICNLTEKISSSDVAVFSLSIKTINILCFYHKTSPIYLYFPELVSSAILDSIFGTLFGLHYKVWLKKYERILLTWSPKCL